jgi:hypothetical protein
LKLSNSKMQLEFGDTLKSWSVQIKPKLNSKVSNKKI